MPGRCRASSGDLLCLHLRRMAEAFSGQRFCFSAGITMFALSAHLARFRREPGALVLLDPGGLSVASDRFGHQWRKAVKAAGAPGLHYHALRQTCASTLLSRGVSVRAVADWLGHASPVVTLTTYAHLMPADDEVARGVLDAAFATPADFSRTEAGIRG
jgi:integrase